MDEQEFYFTSRVIPFEGNGGLIGEGHACSIDTAKDLICETPQQVYWIKATMRPDLSTELDGVRPEFITYTEDLGEVERIFGAIANASFVEKFDKRLPGTYSGYHNTAQTEFSDDTSHECLENLSCRVNAATEGFEFRLFDKASTVAAIHAKLTPSGVDDILSLLGELRSWRDEKFRILEKTIANREPEEPARSPGI